MVKCDLNEDMISVQAPRGSLELTLTRNGKSCVEAIERQIKKDLLFYDIEEAQSGELREHPPDFVFVSALRGISDKRVWASPKDYIKSLLSRGRITLTEVL